MLRRPLGKSPILVSPVAMGCWPIAGMTSLHVNEADSIKTLHTAVEAGINFFDTAYAYGANGESERLIARTLGSQRDQIVIATKCGLAWDENVQRVLDGSPTTLKSQIDESLNRLNTDRVELLYLHAPDPNTPVEESAGAMKEIMQAGKARTIGVSNFSMQQLVAFNSVCPITAVQPPYNLLQRDIEEELRPWCIDNQVSLAVYWPLMKGLLAGKIPRDYTFPPEDGRAKYPMFQGIEWQRNQDFVDELKVIGEEAEKTVAQIAVRWVLQQPGITSALCGAKRAYQIEETAQAMRFELSDAQLQRIDIALQKRGKSNARGAV